MDLRATPRSRASSVPFPVTLPWWRGVNIALAIGMLGLGLVLLSVGWLDLTANTGPVGFLTWLRVHADHDLLSMLTTAPSNRQILHYALHQALIAAASLVRLAAGLALSATGLDGLVRTLRG